MLSKKPTSSNSRAQIPAAGFTAGLFECLADVINMPIAGRSASLKLLASAVITALKTKKEFQNNFLIKEACEETA
jgi:hypothetical protein